MELWTLQHPEVYAELKRNGSYMVDPARIFLPEGGDSDINHGNLAYRWLCSKMDELLEKRPEGASYPIWAWYKQYGREDGKPDMRSSGYAAPGEPLVRLKLEVPDDLVLLSDFDEWHHPLNYWYCAKTKAESEAFDERYQSLELDFHQLNDFSLTSPELAQLREEIVSSWDGIFDVFSEQDENWGFPWVKRTIQATFWELKLDYVQSVEYFTAR